MSIYISVVSHFHTQDIIHELRPHKINNLPDVTVIIKDNTPDFELETYCKDHGIDYIANNIKKGFGHNHNDIFLYCGIKHNMKDEDFFIVLNPDITAEPDVFLALVSTMKAHKVRLAAPNLYQDKRMKVLEGSIRNFPYPWDFVTSFLFNSEKTILNRAKIFAPIKVDWGHGAFLAFEAGLYKSLSGFDPRYYMYCEDVDICWRAKILFNEPTLYLPEIKAIHAAYRHSSNIFSFYFKWHVMSVIRFSSRYLRWKWFGHIPR